LPFSGIRDLVLILALLLPFFWLLFLLVALALDFFSKILSSSKILPFPFTGWELLELAES
jgi:hypothetical protein